MRPYRVRPVVLPGGSLGGEKDAAHVVRRPGEALALTAGPFLAHDVTAGAPVPFRPAAP